MNIQDHIHLFTRVEDGLPERYCDFNQSEIVICIHEKNCLPFLAVYEYAYKKWRLPTNQINPIVTHWLDLSKLTLKQETK